MPEIKTADLLVHFNVSVADIVPESVFDRARSPFCRGGEAGELEVPSSVHLRQDVEMQSSWLFSPLKPQTLTPCGRIAFNNPKQ